MQSQVQCTSKTRARRKAGVIDGSELDQDGVVNGVIVDPAGPAVQGLSATGAKGWQALLIGLSVVAIAAGVQLASARSTSSEIQ